MKRTVLGLMVAASMVLANQVFAADVYKIDFAHSNIGFAVQHMMVSKTTGSFSQYEGNIVYDAADLAASKADVTIQVASIDTNNEKRDEHLKNEDFFDVTKFPTITFVSKKFEADSITGDLTIKGVTKEVTIPVTVTGPLNTPFGTTVIGLNGSFSLNRQDYGIKWNKALDQGGLAVSDEVKVDISIEASKQ